jgi:hypothetical protein
LDRKRLTEYLASPRLAQTHHVAECNLKIAASLVALVVFLWPTASSARQSDQLSLSIGGEAYSFDPVLKQYPTFSIFGAYTRPLSLTAGITLHLYPNSRFTVMRWCDICRGELIGHGEYRLQDGLVTLESADAQKGLQIPSKLLAFHGVIQMPDYITGSKFILISPENLGAAKRDPNYMEYLIMSSAYPDWQAIYDGQLQKSGVSDKP